MQAILQQVHILNYINLKKLHFSFFQCHVNDWNLFLKYYNIWVLQIGHKNNFFSNISKWTYNIFLISNKTSLIKKRHPSTQGVYKGKQIKNENYKSQVNP